MNKENLENVRWDKDFSVYGTIKVNAPEKIQEQRLKRLLNCEFKDTDTKEISFIGRVKNLFNFSKC